MATCVDLAETSYPHQWSGKQIKPLRGQSLRPLLTGTGQFSERPLFWEHEGNAAIRVGDRKLVRQGAKGNWELFDIQADRTEQHDLAATQPDEVVRLERQWADWAREVHALPKPKQKKGRPARQESGSADASK